MEYIEKTLGVSVTLEPWKYADTLPYYILDRYAIQKASIGSVHALFLYPQTELDRVETLRKHITRVQKQEPLPVVLVLPTVSRYRRKALIHARIPFIVPEKQLYLPFLGAVLQERFDPDIQQAEQFQPVAQVLFFYYLYGKQRELYTSQAVKDLGYSAMSISRAAKQLVQTGLFEERKDGVQNVLAGKLDGKTLFETLQPYLIDPVRKRGSMKKEAITNRFCLAGDSALARQTILSDTSVPCYAVDGRKRTVEQSYLLDGKEYVSVELWKYDPMLLSRDGVVDPLSLAMSVKSDPDERVEEAIDGMLEEFWEEEYGRRN